ncbi:MAG: hypothetical protein U0K91_07195 [Acutalibacteraceae bacterium]|nr:hypothetical protein [Acutalibacteraceae bacterium]
MKESVTPWVMKVCPICGKEFLPAGQHSWKIGEYMSYEKLVCSYSCMRKWEKGAKNGKGRYKKPCNNGKKIAVRIVETGKEYDTITKCAKALYVSNTTIYNCLYNGKTIDGLHIEKVDK